MTAPPGKKPFAPPTTQEGSDDVFYVVKCQINDKIAPPPDIRGIALMSGGTCARGWCSKSLQVLTTDHIIIYITDTTRQPDQQDSRNTCRKLHWSPPYLCKWSLAKRSVLQTTKIKGTDRHGLLQMTFWMIWPAPCSSVPLQIRDLHCLLGLVVCFIPKSSK